MRGQVRWERCTIANASLISENSSGSTGVEKSTPWISATKVGWSSLTVMCLKSGSVRRPGILYFECST